MRFKKYDIVEIEWLDSHSIGGWKSPKEVKDWIERANNDFLIKTLGYFVQEDKNFIRICQSYDSQHLNPDGERDDNKDNLFAVARKCIERIRIIKKNGK